MLKMCKSVLFNVSFLKLVRFCSLDFYNRKLRTKRELGSGDSRTDRIQWRDENNGSIH